MFWKDAGVRDGIIENAEIVVDESSDDYLPATLAFRARFIRRAQESDFGIDNPNQIIVAHTLGPINSPVTAITPPTQGGGLEYTLSFNHLYGQNCTFNGNVYIRPADILGVRNLPFVGLSPCTQEDETLARYVPVLKVSVAPGSMITGSILVQPERDSGFPPLPFATYVPFTISIADNFNSDYESLTVAEIPAFTITTFRHSVSIANLADFANGGKPSLRFTSSALPPFLSIAASGGLYAISVTGAAFLTVFPLYFVDDLDFTVEVSASVHIVEPPLLTVSIIVNLVTVVPVFYPAVVFGDMTAFGGDFSSGEGDYQYSVASPEGRGVFLITNGNQIAGSFSITGMHTIVAFADDEHDGTRQARAFITISAVESIYINALSVIPRITTLVEYGTVATFRSGGGILPHVYRILSPPRVELGIVDEHLVLTSLFQEADTLTVTIAAEDNSHLRARATMFLTIAAIAPSLSASFAAGLSVALIGQNTVIATIKGLGGYRVPEGLYHYSVLASGSGSAVISADIDGAILLSASQPGLHTLTAIVDDDHPHTPAISFVLTSRAAAPFSLSLAYPQTLTTFSRAVGDLFATLSVSGGVLPYQYQLPIGDILGISAGLLSLNAELDEVRNLRLSIDVRGSDDLGLHSAVEVIVAIVPPLSLSISVSTDITELTIGRLAFGQGGLWRRLSDHRRRLGRVVYGGGYLTIGGDYHTNVNIGGAAAIPVLLSGGYVAISAFAAGSVFVTLAVSDDHPATPAGFAEFGVLAFNSPLSLDVNHLPRTTITQGGNLNSHLAAQLVAAGGLPPYTYSFSVVNSAGVSWGDGGGLSVSLNNVNIAPDTLFVRATGFVEDAAGDLATVQLTATIAKVLATLQLTFANHQQHIVNDVGNFATLGIVSVVNLPAGALANVKVRYSHLATSGGIYDANLIPQIINGDLFVIVVNTVANGESLVLKNRRHQESLARNNGCIIQTGLLDIFHCCGLSTTKCRYSR